MNFNEFKECRTELSAIQNLGDIMNYILLFLLLYQIFLRSEVLISTVVLKISYAVVRMVNSYVLYL